MAIVVDKSHRWRVVLAHVFLICLVLVVIFPFLMILSISLRPGNFAAGSLIPEQISFEHWKLALGISYTAEDGRLVKPDFPVLLWLWNSVKVAGLTAIITLFLSTTAAYAFARMQFRGKQASLAGLMLMQMFPSVLALVAIYAIFDRIGNVFPTFGIDSHWSLLLAYSGGIALHVWTIKGYFDTIPVEIEEAAKVDGATPWQAFRLVLLPMAVPILMVVFLLAFIGAIIEYPVASILLHEEAKLTLAVGSKLFLYEQKYLWGDFAAAAILSGLPITVVFILAQKWMISGLTAGGIKG
ncbi:maltose ABC transporter permease MalG [Piscinibacter gummiphilus]|jgi:maltose/maltodextrin transport system permease protein|uniref:Maltose/maltodextrin transport system permease protein MalG n=1 Tax=Piscinibacter gummiphilus TaxID=946333 RepID=A0A1W6L4S9_9BURK|nr:maltose ABC transporter permease MalG [Piscinibacter gummiphilus]ARN19187.1 maltose transporter permease [Piscinibacter gummiphilus]ATU63847.1 maltose ABC transporter permease MalG [Piscinibacter gummiphilus]GLS93207.1 maltose transport system permease protein MalG [Piscinibacter gummiphilus]